MEDILARPPLRLDGFVTLVDARSLAEDFELGERLVDLDEGDQVAALLVAQLQLATVILLTKTDKVSAQLVERIATNLTQVNPAARLYNVQYGKIAPDLVLDLGGLHPVALQEISDWGSNCDIGSTVISDPRPLHPERLWKAYREQLGLGIHRSKGFLWLPSRDQDVLLWNQCGGMVEMELTAYWKASLVKNPDQRLFPEEIAALRQMLEGAHPVFGDRACELTIIGTAADRAIFADTLKQCFCTEEEIAAWQRGDTFPDPWPRTLRQV